MYYNFISLKDAPLSLQEAVENMHMVVQNEWGHDDWVEVSKVIESFKDTKKLLIDVLTMEYKDKNILLLFKMALYRFCTIHIPEILKNIQNNNSDHIDLRLYGQPYFNSSLVEWEKNFWEMTYSKKITTFGERRKPRFASMGDTMSVSNYRWALRTREQVQPTDEKYYALKETMEIAFKDESTIQAIQKLQLQYEPFSNKAVKLNSAMKHISMTQVDETIMAIQGMKRMIDIMGRNVQGNLTAGDAMELEELLPKWEGQNIGLSTIFTKII